jgi:hypothetical protein
LFHRDSGGRIYAMRAKPCASQLIRERHGEAGRIGGGDQFVGIRGRSSCIGLAKYRVCESAPLSVVIAPFPRLKPPIQLAEAFGFMKTVSKIKTDLEYCKMALRFRSATPATN